MNPWLKIALILGTLAIASVFAVALLMRMRREKASAPLEKARANPDACEDAEDIEPEQDDAEPEEAEEPESLTAEAAEAEPASDPVIEDPMAGRLSRLRSRGLQEQEDVLAPITLSRVAEPVLPQVIDEERFPEVEGTPEEQAEAARTAELKAMIKAEAQPAIAFRREFPPEQTNKITTFFGGEPYAPAEFEWPRSQTTRLPLTFMGQIDCRALPGFAARQHVPSTGILYFFADLSRQSGLEDGSYVLHLEGQQGPLYEHPAPDFAPRCFGAEAPLAFPWIDRTKASEDRFPRIFPKWAMTAAAIETYPDTSPAKWDDDTPGRHEELRRALVEKCWADALDMPPAAAPLVPQDDAGEDSVWLPFPEFPHSWRAIELVSGQLLHDLYARRIAEEKVRVLLEQANSWVERARAEKLQSSPSPEDAEAFRDWLAALAKRDDLLSAHGNRNQALSLVNTALGKVAALSVEQALREGGGQARAIPNEAVERVATRHTGMLGHQMLGLGAIMAGEAPTYAERHVLLIQLHDDAALWWAFGGGAWQYWILPSDLAARRFDRTVLIWTGAAQG
ncbi:MAG: DUF1963 domain-containing protein [Sphingomonadales bacterium]|nr:DUF1963 domain-containing protein [Sphingomonadales bacterium]